VELSVDDCFLASFRAIPLSTYALALRGGQPPASQMSQPNASGAIPVARLSGLVHEWLDVLSSRHFFLAFPMFDYPRYMELGDPGSKSRWAICMDNQKENVEKQNSLYFSKVPGALIGSDQSNDTQIRQLSNLPL
jgi:hypothetical protein